MDWGGLVEDCCGVLAGGLALALEPFLASSCFLRADNNCASACSQFCVSRPGTRPLSSKMAWARRAISSWVGLESDFVVCVCIILSPLFSVALFLEERKPILLRPRRRPCGSVGLNTFLLHAAPRGRILKELCSLADSVQWGVNLRAIRVHPLFLAPDSRAGMESKARISANTAPTVIPTSRNGSERSQIKGRRISATTATGQHSTNRIHHPMNRMRIFTS
jgi:hypothetical protein